MRLSLRAIELCRIKFGKGVFVGFESIDESILSGISEVDARRDFDELTQNGIIDFIDDDIHISALGQHIFNMMLEPEQYIMLDNTADNICARIYIRNTYYLCVLEDKKVKSNDVYDRYIFELLPRLDLLVGSFAYVLHRNKKHMSVADGNRQVEQDIRIVGKAWNKDRKIISEIMICGKYHMDAIQYQMVEQIDGVETKVKELESETSELVNKLTKWMFEKISAINENEVC